MSAARMTATLPSATSSATTNIVTEEMVETPTARPSSPSMRLTELVMPTIQRMVTGTASTPRMSASFSLKMLGFISTSMTTPWATATMAAMIWMMSLTQARSEMMSSIAPQATMRTAPSRMPRTWRVMSTKRTTLRMKPRKMARPPMRGMGWSWTRRASLGTSMAPTFCAKVLTMGVEAKLTAKPMAMAKSARSHSSVLRNIAHTPEFRRAGSASGAAETLVVLKRDSAPQRAMKPSFL